MIATEESPSQISDRIKDILFAKAADKIDYLRPEVSDYMFNDSEEYWWFMSDLSDFFKLVAKEKQRKDQEFKDLVGEDIEDIVESIFKPSPKKKIKKKKVKFEKVEESFSNLTSEVIVEKDLGLLSEPSNVKQKNDPLTPLNQNFATLEDLQNHYKLFLNRIQQQLSTMGGGGEVNLAFMEMPIRYVTTNSYIITPNDYYIGVNYSGAVTITLPTPRKNGKMYIVKDELGEASKGTNRYITILPSGTDKIDGQDRAILAYDFGSLTFVYRDGWRIV